LEMKAPGIGARSLGKWAVINRYTRYRFFNTGRKRSKRVNYWW
jgi:GTPase SAR1 family protein